MEKQKGHYGLPTAIAMIIGIVVGSGIFFKADDVLLYTGGSVGLGVLVFCIGAFSIVFGSLTLTELSVRTEKSGGVVGYYEEFISKKMAAGFGWFQTFAYYPSLISVVAWVASVYTCSLFDVTATLELQILIALIFIILLYAMNYLSVKLGGYFQNFSTVVKLVPLIGIAIAGFILKSAQPELPVGVEAVRVTDNVGMGWLAALIPIAFSNDGWIVATTISNEVKNPKRTMPLAFIIGPLTVLAVYLLYFVGFCKLLGAEYIMTMGNDAVNKAGEYLFGASGVKIMLVFMIIAVMGVGNGMTLGSIRIPQALASKNMLPGSKKIERINAKYELSPLSCLISFAACIVWLGLHYITQKTGILGNGDVSEITIVFSYGCFAILYIKVFLMTKAGIIKNKFLGYVCPVLATFGSLSILLGGLVVNPLYVPVFIVICFAICYLGFAYYNRQEKSMKEPEFIAKEAMDL